MRPMTSETKEKLRGGVYTPRYLADFITSWVVEYADTILEPSCGDGAFLESLMSTNRDFRKVVGIEIDDIEVEKAKIAVGDFENYQILHMDFFDYSIEEKFDAVLGNPPYIRYQYLSDEDQEFASNFFSSMGLNFTKHTNAWVTFLIKSIAQLNPNGRLGMVIPAELLNVIHAGAAREYLLKECSKILILDTDDLLFDDILQRTVVLAVQKKNSIDEKSFLAIETVDKEFLETRVLDDYWERSLFVETPVSRKKWMSKLLNPDEERVYQKAVNAMPHFEEIASVQVGIVTGANKFFLVTKDAVEKYELHEYTKPMFGRSSYVRGLIYSQLDHEANIENGLPCYFLDFNGYEFEELSQGAKDYILYGESLELHLRYKTRIREPWFAVPSIYRTKISLMKRSNEAPRLIYNEAFAYTTDTAYRIDTKYPAASIVFSWMNSVTLLAAELGGRTYGGGVLELVPSEIRNLPFPYVDASLSQLQELDKSVRSQEPLSNILQRQNKLIAQAYGLSEKEMQLLENARVKLMHRRQRRKGRDA